MADIPSDGNIRVSWVTTIANTSAPTVAELNAGLLLSPQMTPAGLSGFQPDTNDVPNRRIDGTFNTVDVGSVNVSGTALEFYKQTGTDTIYDTLTYRTSGYLVVRRSVDKGTAWASGQKVAVWPVKCGQTAWLDPEADTEERYRIPVKVVSEPAIRAAVA